MTARALKYIAVFTMIIDHVGATLNTLYRFDMAGAEMGGYMSDAYWYLRVIGRLAFPLFAFLIAEGCAHTRDIKRYIGRLAVFAAISQVPYQLFRNVCNGPDNLFRFSGGNVMITLTLGAVAVFFYQRLFTASKTRWLNLLGIVGAYAAMLLLQSEFDLCGMLVILLCYALRPKEEGAPHRRPGSRYAQAGIVSAVPFLYSFIISASWIQQIAVAYSGVFVIPYNGKPGSKKGKWFFYAFYPAHLLILSGIMYLYMT